MPEIVIIGPAPDAHDLRVGLPFGGRVGRILLDAMAEAGLRREDVTLLTLSSVRPPRDEFRALDASRLKADIARTHETLRHLRPKVTVALGAYVAHALIPDWPDARSREDGLVHRGAIFGATDIENRRGYVFDSPFGPVVATVDPAFVDASWSPWRVLLSLDLQRAVKVASDGLIRPTRDVEIIRTARDASRAVGALRRQRVLASDIETWGDTSLACIGFAGESGKAYVFPTEHLDRASELLGDADLTLVWANGIYDLFVLRHRYGVPIRARLDDVQVMWHCLPGWQTVETLKGPVPIKDLVGRSDIWIWGYDGERPKPVKMRAAFKTRKNAPLLRVKFLRRGAPGNARKWYPSDESAVEEVVCTPEHRFMLLDGSWVEAKDLKCGDGLMHAKFSTHRNGRRFINWNRKGVQVSRYVWESLHGKIPSKHEIHHVDEDFTNDEPENLECLTKKEHNERHDKHAYLDQTGRTSARAGTIGGSRPDYEELEKLYVVGMSIKALARHYQAAESTIKTHLEQAGVRLRTFSEAQVMRRARERNARVLEVEILTTKEDVYCLESDSGNFFVNGLVVHNSSYPELAGAREDKRKHRFTRKSLSFLASLSTYDLWWKGDYETRDEFFIYNGKDCLITLDVYEFTKAEVERVGAEATYEHERGLIMPCVDMLARGLRVDEPLRQERVAALTSTLEAATTEALAPVIPWLAEKRETARDPKTFRLFESVERTCECCGHASKKQQACWACVGFKSAPSKKDLTRVFGAFTGTKAEMEARFLPVCRVCEGRPRETKLEVNLNSNHQMKALLFDILKLPKRASTDEATLKGLLAGLGDEG